MNFNRSSDKDISVSVKLTNSQAELLMLVEKLVCLAISDAIINMQAMPEVCRGPFLKL
jgi:hypothetical protein